MKIWHMLALATVLLSGCATKIEMPKGHPDKYTFQVIALTIPESEIANVPPLDLMNGTTPNLEAFIQDSNSKLIEYPLVVAGLGECVTNDQTKAVSLPKGFNMVDGEPVAMEEIRHLGYRTAVRVNKVESGKVSFGLDTHFEKLIGYDTYQVAEGVTVEMPYSEARTISTQLELEPNKWSMLGGLVDERSNGEKRNEFICVRAIPPAAKQ